jgi:hypothetical protein
MNTSPLLQWPALFLSAQALLLGDAEAYIDPGMGSYFFQLLVAGFFAGLYGLRLYWGRLRSLCAKIFKTDRE